MEFSLSTKPKRPSPVSPRPSVSFRHSRIAIIQRKCACGGSTGTCDECNSRKRFGLQTKLKVSEPGDKYEQEADRVADQVISSASPNSAVTSSGPTIQRYATQARGQMSAAPAGTSRVFSGPAKPLEPVLRGEMEQRFGYDFSRVRVHFGAAAEQSARHLNADAYTVGQDIVFGAGRFAPHTGKGRRLIAHELTHVVQQSGGVVARNSVLQRQPSHQNETQAQYEQKVKQGTWCRDSEKTGALHDPNQQCYRELVKNFDEEAGQVCFDKKTGKFAESSPDFVSAVSGINKDGTCDIPLGLFDPPNPFTKRGQRALGHGIADVCAEDPGMCGKYFGRISGVAMGIALPKGDPNFLGKVAVPALFGALGGWLADKSLPKFDKFARRHGFTPTLSLGFGTNLGLSLGSGFEKRDRPLPLVPINTYLTFSFDSSLAAKGESAFLAKVGVRIDPGKQGGIFALGSLGAG